MEDALANIRDLIGIVCFAGFFCCLPGAAFGYFAYYLGYELPRTVGAPRRLAGQMGLKQLETGRDYGHTWFGGEHKGRAFAITVERERKVWASQRGPHQAHLKVLMEVKVSQPLGAFALRNMTGSLESFDSAFQTENPERLPAGVRARLLDFVRKSDPNPRATTTQFTSGRNLRLRDRRDPSKGEPLPQAHTFLVHDLVNVLKSSPENVRVVLDELAEIADVIERGN